MRVHDPRRQAPRSSADGRGGGVTARELRPAAMSDLASRGLRLRVIR